MGMAEIQALDESVPCKGFAVADVPLGSQSRAVSHILSELTDSALSDARIVLSWFKVSTDS